MSAHTPTPWRVDGADIVSPSECAVVATVQWCGEGRDGESEANAAHIVRCVNAHDELVAACQLAFKRGEGNNDEEHDHELYAALKAALAKVADYE